MNHELTDEVVAALPLRDGRTELLEEIMATPVHDRVEDRPARPRRTDPRWLVPLAAAATVLAAVAVPFVLSGDEEPGGAGAPAATASEQPKAKAPQPTTKAPAPGSRHRAVLTEPGGWRIDHVGETSHGGDLNYVRDDGEWLEINWYPADAYDSYVEDREDLGRTQAVTLLGEAAQLWRYAATDHTVIGAPSNGWFLEVRGSGVSKREFVVLLDRLRRVDSAGFEAAVGESVVLPAALAATIETMLADITVPRGFDAGRLDLDGEFNQRYDVGARVTEAVTCAWLERYAAGQESGDRALVERAASAMAESHDWAVLLEMAEDGDWPSGIWQTADEMTAGEPAISVMERSVCASDAQ